MSLPLTNQPVSVAFDAASFFMTDDDRTIRADVCKDLLKGIERTPPKSSKEYADRVRRHKMVFGQIASLKYLRGEYKHEVNVLVVRITEDDL
jgi:hypothetical protein